MMHKQEVVQYYDTIIQNYGDSEDQFWIGYIRALKAVLGLQDIEE